MWANGKFLSAITVTRHARGFNVVNRLGVCVLLFGLLVIGVSARANSIQVDPDQIARIEAYLNGITTLRSRFLQKNPDGSISEGVLYLHRPGKLRFEYDPPDPYLIMVKDDWLIFIDKELAQTTYIMVEKTPAFFLTQQNVRFAENFDITRFERSNGTVRLGIQARGDESSGNVTLIFSDKPLSLRKWRAFSIDGGETETTLINPSFNAALKGDVFEFEEPPTNTPN